MPHLPHILVIDAEPGVREVLEAITNEYEFTLAGCTTAQAALHLAEDALPDVVIMDLRLADVSGLEALDRVRQAIPHQPVIVVTSIARTDTAIEAMKRGAFDYLLKPVDGNQFRHVVKRALEVAMLNRASRGDIKRPQPRDDVETESLIGKSPAMQEVYKAIGRVARQDVAVLILGESGTGKELVARAVCRFSHRSQQPFVAINCAAISESLLESELFGYERGAFTGADECRPGKFEFAHGGTVFLDEIADMSPNMQAKILRLIQEQRFERIGGTQTVKTDVRLIAATNKNLTQMVAAGTFRQDLYYRINGFTLELPPLRARPGDIPLLTDHFIRQFNREMKRGVRAIAPEALEWLLTQSWPGNIRELQSTIKYAMINAQGNVLTRNCFPTAPVALDASPGTKPAETNGIPGLNRLVRELLHNDPGTVYRRISEVVDHIALREALSHAKGNQLQAAALLGISRTTLRAKLRSLGLSVEKQLSDIPD